MGGDLAPHFPEISRCVSGRQVYLRHIGILIYVIRIAGGDKLIFEKSEYEIIVVD